MAGPHGFVKMQDPGERRSGLHGVHEAVGGQEPPNPTQNTSVTLPATHIISLTTS